MPERRSDTKALVVILAAIGLDALGIGLVFPILPRLVADVTRAENVAPYIGILAALYAAVQLVFAPVLGALSDRLGRRPVLLLSLAGAAINYLMMAFAPTLSLLLVGRAVAGLTSANLSVATAYITDITKEGERARRFGLVNAIFGAGFIVGPVLGGVLGEHWLRLPFLAAAALNGANLAVALFVLPESRAKGEEPIDVAALSPLRSLRWALSMKDLRPIMLVFFLLATAGEAYGTCWALWGSDVFGWNGVWIGLSLGAFGVCQSLAQAFLPAPTVARLGERRAVLFGLLNACAALVVMAFARRGWMVFAMMPMFALGGVGTPALQSLGTRLVDSGQQGQFQGVLASALSFASIVGPLAFSTFYFVVRREWPGAVWLSVIGLQVVAMVIVHRLSLFAARER